MLQKVKKLGGRCLFFHLAFALYAKTRLRHQFKPHYGDVFVAFFTDTISVFLDAYLSFLQLNESFLKIFYLRLYRFMPHLFPYVGVNGCIV